MPDQIRHDGLCKEHAKSSFRRTPVSSRQNLPCITARKVVVETSCHNNAGNNSIDWMPDQVRHDGLCKEHAKSSFRRTPVSSRQNLPCITVRKVVVETPCHNNSGNNSIDWMPAFAGMTNIGKNQSRCHSGERRNPVDKFFLIRSLCLTIKTPAPIYTRPSPAPAGS